MDDQNELVIVLRPGLGPGTDIAGVNVIHQLSPEVMIVRIASGLTIQPPRGVTVVYAGEDPPPDVLAGLANSERLFVEAWRSNLRSSKRRPGEGLPWDAEGMSPPDLPPAQSDTS